MTRRVGGAMMPALQIKQSRWGGEERAGVAVWRIQVKEKKEMQWCNACKGGKRRVMPPERTWCGAGLEPATELLCDARDVVQVAQVQLQHLEGGRETRCVACLLHLLMGGWWCMEHGEVRGCVDMMVG